MCAASLPSAQRVQLLVLERVDPARNMARYYVLSVESTLFDDAALVREWGRLGSLGRRRVDLYAKASDARLALGVWLERKTRRGYVARFCRGPNDAA
jgi:predicted DNA-binding WGR domain protein